MLGETHCSTCSVKEVPSVIFNVFNAVHGKGIQNAGIIVQYDCESEEILIFGNSYLKDQVQAVIQKNVVRLKSMYREELSIATEEMDKCRNVVTEVQHDCDEFGDSAICIFDETSNQVIFMSSNYAVLSKMKHKVRLKMGYIKESNRRHRRSLNPSFDSSSKEEMHQSSPCHCRVYTTTSLLDLKVDCIVNPVNDHGDVGIGTLIKTAAGKDFQEELTKCGPIPVGQQRLTFSGDLTFKCVINTRLPHWKDYRSLVEGNVNLDECEEDMFSAIHGCLIAANEIGMKSIAIPCCSGIFAIPGDICLAVYASAVLEYGKYPVSKELTQIHLVDENPDITQMVTWSLKRALEDGIRPTYDRDAHIKVCSTIAGARIGHASTNEVANDLDDINDQSHGKEQDSMEKEIRNRLEDDHDTDITCTDSDFESTKMDVKNRSKEPKDGFKGEKDRCHIS